MPETTTTIAARLRLPQVRILVALKDAGGPLNRMAICLATGITPTSGTFTWQVNGTPEGSSQGKPHPGLVRLGLVNRREFDIDGVIEVNYQLTARGRHTLALWLAAGNVMTPPRDKASAINRRYRA